MTEPLHHSFVSESLDEALRLNARAAALPRAVEQQPAEAQLATASRLGRILQAGTVAADAVALAAALAYLDLTRDPRVAAAVVPAGGRLRIALVFTGSFRGGGVERLVWECARVHLLAREQLGRALALGSPAERT